MAVFIGILFFFLLPESPSRPTSLLLPRLCVFNEREREILKSRILLDDARQAHSGDKMHVKKDVLGTILTWRVWPHVLITIVVPVANTVLILYTPSIIQSFKFESESLTQRL